jgi:hypothetical protein
MDTFLPGLVLNLSQKKLCQSVLVYGGIRLSGDFDTRLRQPLNRQLLVKTVQLAHKKIWILTLALAVMLLAPFKALSTPINAIADDGCAIVRACCATMQHCCCDTSPKLPTDMGSAASFPPQPKFVSIKGSGKVISQELPRPLLSRRPKSMTAQMSAVSAPASRPLYILNRALLI